MYRIQHVTDMQILYYLRLYTRGLSVKSKYIHCTRKIFRRIVFSWVKFILLISNSNI